MNNVVIIMRLLLSAQQPAGCQGPLFIIIMNATIGQWLHRASVTTGFLCYVIMGMNSLNEVKPL